MSDICQARKLPFLHRNWITATNMGLKHSSPSRQAGDRFIDDEDYHPAKRRRVANTPPISDGLPVREESWEQERSLRIDISKIIPKELPHVRKQLPLSFKDLSEMKVRCKIILSCVRDGPEPYEVLHVDTQICALHCSRNPLGDGPLGQLSIAPFIIPENKILVQSDEDDAFQLAKKYDLKIELQSAATGDVLWPPLGILSPAEETGRSVHPRHWVLAASVKDFLSPRGWHNPRVYLKKQAQDVSPVDFRLEVDIKWSMPIEGLSSDRSEKDLLRCITVGPKKPIPSPLSPLSNIQINGHDSHSNDSHYFRNRDVRVIGVNGVNHVNGVNGVNHVNGVNGHTEYDDRGVALALHDQLNGHGQDLEDGVDSPTRSRRVRNGKINYNVRQMWNTAVGKEPRKRRKISKHQSEEAESGLTYVFPPEALRLDTYCCVLCGCINNSISQLRAHLDSHPHYKFHFEHSQKGGHVSVSQNPIDPGSPIRPQIYQLGLPLFPLDLDKYVEGDESWVTSRFGPDNDRDVVARKILQPKSQQKLLSKKAFRKPITVPIIKQPLYDTTSKAELVPGSELPPQKADMSWLISKHRDTLQDFTDVEAAEKDYMIGWDAFVQTRYISSDLYVERAMKAFVKEKASWIVENPVRAEEFGKHVATLMGRRVVSASGLHEITQRLAEARANKKPAAAAVAAKTSTSKPSADVCLACKEPVPVSEVLICSNPDCQRRVYHCACVPEVRGKSRPIRDWLCAPCEVLRHQRVMASHSHEPTGGFSPGFGTQPDPSQLQPQESTHI